ncbi:hypothetical protein Thermo_00900 [Thermoplasmatales archaeon]|nr:hypothetical protein Thermo_00900 [Thermoplasmatales archaeon]
MSKHTDRNHLKEQLYKQREADAKFADEVGKNEHLILFS